MIHFQDQKSIQILNFPQVITILYYINQNHSEKAHNGVGKHFLRTVVFNCAEVTAVH